MASPKGNGKLKGILCVNMAGVIGDGGELMYRCPADMKRFKEYTTGKIVVMGRGTAESLPNALPDRINLVISSIGYQREGFFSVPSVEEFYRRWNGVNDVVFIGGAKLAEEFRDKVDEWELSVVRDMKIGSARLKGGMRFFDGLGFKVKWQGVDKTKCGKLIYFLNLQRH